MTDVTFAEFVEQRFGKLESGSHTPDGAACFHEALNIYQGKPWSDDTSGTLSLIGLNDAPWSSDAVRTEHMLPLGSIILAWPSWSTEKRQAWAKVVATETIRQILPLALRALAERVPAVAPDLIAAALRCETTPNRSAARSAAASAATAAAWSTAEAAADAAAVSAAAWTAESAAEAAAEAESLSAAAAAWAAEASATMTAWSATTTADAAADAADQQLIALCKLMVEAAR